MSKFSKYSRNSEYQEERDKRTRIHPVWRGIGFIVMVGIPFLAYFLGLYLIGQNELNGWTAIPRDLLARGADPLLYIKIGLTITLSILLYVLFSFLGVIVYQIAGHQRYGEFDAPPETRAARRKF